MSYRPAWFRRLLGTPVMVAVIASLMIAGAPPSNAVNTPQDAIVNPNPADWTPNVLDGQINSIVQIGNTGYAAGRFTQVQAASGGTIFSRSNIFAFDATTGAINTTFAPTFDDTIKVLYVGPDGNLFVGGYFNAVNGDTTAKKLVKLNPSTGARITAFNVNTVNGQVWDVVARGSRLIVGGKFTTIKSVARDRFAVLDTTTGAVDPNVSFSITDPHTSDSVPWVYNLDVTPDGSKVVIIGNFMKVNGLPRPQIAMLDLSTTPASVANWQTDLYAPLCFSNAFDTYMRDVDFSPDGAYFVVGVTGGPNVGTLCDTTVRWETGAQGSALQPTWVDVTGGDTISQVAVTGAAVYSGGHQRWQNNYYGQDNAGPGAVDRPGISALDPSNGVPFSWNPTKDRGTGVYALYATTTGLWMGSDTDHTNGELHRKLVFFPLAGGKTPPPTDPYTLPGDLYDLPISSCSGGDSSILYRVNAGGAAVPSADCGPDWLADDSDGAPGAAYRNTGSNAAGWAGQAFTVDGTVPSSTPGDVFTTERWDPSDGQEMQWSFPVASGTHLQVRLYLINQYDGTSGVGQRVFNVSIDGNTVLNNEDLVADVGNRVGTMKAFNITSDGTVNIDFAHVVENPLINGIEIINTDVPPPPPPGAINFLRKRTFDGTTLGTPENLNTPSMDWSTTRGIFAVQGSLYYGSSNGNFYTRTFDGQTLGPEQLIDKLGITDFPTQSLTGMFLDHGRLYFTLKGDPNLYYRYFTPESRILGSFRFTAPSAGVNWGDIRGLTLANGKLYFGRSDGNLSSMDFANGSPVSGTEVLVSPKSAGYDWASNGLFVFPHVTVDTTPPTQPGKPSGSSPGSGSITISWAASQDDSPPITYTVFRDGNQVGTTTNTTFTDTDPVNLTPGSQHTYTVNAKDALNNGPSQMSLPSDPITVASAIFTDDFSSGNFTKWSSVTRLTIDNGQGGVAPPSARGEVTNQTAFAYKNLDTPLGTMCVSANVNVASFSSTAPTLFRLRTAANGAIAKVYVSLAGTLYIRSDAAGTQINSAVAMGSGWHLIKLCGTVGTSGSWDLYRDGVKIVNAWSANTGTTAIGRVEIGNAQATTSTINFDDVVFDLPQAPPVDTDPPTTPGKPSGSSPGVGTINISWGASQDASPPITYTVFRDGNQVGTTTATNFTDNDPALTEGSQHTYTVNATDSLNNGPSPMSPVSDPITVASAIFSDDFSSGNFTKWSSVTNLTIDNGSGGVAPPSARGQVTNQTAYAYKDLTSPLSTMCVSANVNLASFSSTAPTLFRLRTGVNGAIAKVYVSLAGTLYIRSDAAGTQINSGVAMGNGYHNIELCITVGAPGTADLYRDGVKIVNAWSSNTGTTPVGRVEIGNAQATTSTINFDDVVFDLGPG